MSVASIDWSKVDSPEPVLQRFPSRRSVVYGTKGIVAASQPLAVEAGLEILRKGGNAADAAVATSAALNVTEPSACGIGGDAFCLFYNAKDKSVSAMNGSGRAPAKLTIDYVLSRGVQGKIPASDINSATVPGCAAAWVDTVDKFGSGKLSLAEILDPAIRLAEEGYPVSEIHSLGHQRSEELIKNASPNGNEMLLDGKAPLPGQIFKVPTLAETFRTLAREGKDGFYKGRIAEEIVNLIQSRGGLMELDDLARHKTEFVEPIKFTFAGEVTLYECPPNGQGLTALVALGILEQMQEQGKIRDLLAMEYNSPEYLHALVEALRLAFADTQHFITDPNVVPVPVKELLSKEYLASRAALFDPTSSGTISHGNPIHSSDTVYFTVSDEHGNACSYIQSNYTGFGTGAVPKGCGFTLQNRGSNFSLDKSHHNALEGNKRTYHTIIPALALRGDDLWLSYGVMGGFMQPQGHIQVLLNMLRGFTPQAALDAPRFCISAGSPDSGLDNAERDAGDINSEVFFEEGIPEETVAKLRSMGHDAHSLGGFKRSLFGRGQVIQKINDKSGKTVWAAGSDPRADGHAAAQIGSEARAPLRSREVSLNQRDRVRSCVIM
ncbi:gamma-glutamyltranspeptidase [Vararia minispora EC-137]|uniref:Gamma-glutamyltranspeptidase n=1 Tax=Vararia minispora EC-137 TaxID=1314806 RepID=A0ACB8QS55_9AGAM|nr:gamma-glutamyltranspeptidase [Vararia minispora EC-137]